MVLSPKVIIMNDITEIISLHIIKIVFKNADLYFTVIHPGFPLTHNELETFDSISLRFSKVFVYRSVNSIKFQRLFLGGEFICHRYVLHYT